MLWQFGHQWLGDDVSAETFVVKKEMAVTHAEFFRSFPNALRGEDCSIRDRLIIVASSSGTWTVELGPEGRRKIALLSLPMTQVKLKFENYSDIERQKVLNRFDRAFQRAGG